MHLGIVAQYINLMLHVSCSYEHNLLQGPLKINECFYWLVFSAVHVSLQSDEDRTRCFCNRARIPVNVYLRVCT